MRRRALTEREKAEARLRRAERGLKISVWVLVASGAVAITGWTILAINGALQ